MLLYDIRLSGWMWVAFAGYAGSILRAMLMSLASAMMPRSLLLTVDLALDGVSSLLLVVGLAMTFRDVRRRLTSREA